MAQADALTRLATSITIRATVKLAIALLALAASLVGTAPESEAASSRTVAVGRTLFLDGPGSGDRIKVTVLGKRDPAHSNNQFVEPDAGNRFVSFKVRIVNVGRDRYEDLVSFDLIDQKSQQWSGAFWKVTEPTLSSVNIGRGDKRVGWINFEIPKRAVVKRLIFEPWFGFGETGEWRY